MRITSDLVREHAPILPALARSRCLHGPQAAFGDGRHPSRHSGTACALRRHAHPGRGLSLHGHPLATTGRLPVTPISHHTTRPANRRARAPRDPRSRRIGRCAVFSAVTDLERSVCRRGRGRAGRAPGTPRRGPCGTSCGRSRGPLRQPRHHPGHHLPPPPPLQGDLTLRVSLEGGPCERRPEGRRAGRCGWRDGNDGCSGRFGTCGGASQAGTRAGSSSGWSNGGVLEPPGFRVRAQCGMGFGAGEVAGGTWG